MKKFIRHKSPNDEHRIWPYRPTLGLSPIHSCILYSPTTFSPTFQPFSLLIAFSHRLKHQLFQPFSQLLSNLLLTSHFPFCFRCRSWQFPSKEPFHLEFYELGQLLPQPKRSLCRHSPSFRLHLYPLWTWSPQETDLVTVQLACLLLSECSGIYQADEVQVWKYYFFQKID